MQIAILEPNHQTQPPTYGFLLTFASTRQKAVTWQTDKPVNRKEMVETVLARVIRGLHDDVSLAGETDRRELNPASLVAALDAAVADCNQRVVRSGG